MYKTQQEAEAEAEALSRSRYVYRRTGNEHAVGASGRHAVVRVAQRAHVAVGAHGHADRLPAGRERSSRKLLVVQVSNVNHIHVNLLR